MFGTAWSGFSLIPRGLALQCRGYQAIRCAPAVDCRGDEDP